jgi:hypothetical protein
LRITAALIVRNEVEHLDSCLTSLKGLVDELVVVDTGSEDESAAVARDHGAIVETVPWSGDFAVPRNRSLELATGQWVLYVDADERMHCDDPAALHHDLGDAADVIAFRVRFVPRIGWTPYREWRLWRNDPEIRFEGAIHETVVPSIERRAAMTGLRTAKLEGATITHLGYEGDQSAKHARNKPILQRAVEATPDRLFLYDHLARIAEDEGDDAGARATWRLGIAVARSQAADQADARLLWTNLIVHSVARGDPDGDVDARIDEARARYPEDPALLFSWATRELESGRPDRAAPVFQRLTSTPAHQLTGTGTSYDARLFDEWSWSSLGQCRLALGEDGAAADALGHAEAAAPDNPAYRVRRQLAEARARDGQPASTARRGS